MFPPEIKRATRCNPKRVVSHNRDVAVCCPGQACDGVRIAIARQVKARRDVGVCRRGLVNPYRRQTQRLFDELIP